MSAATIPLSSPTMVLSVQARRGVLGARAGSSGAMFGTAVVAVAFAVSSPGSPTGTAIWDGVLKAALAAAVVAAGSKSPRWSVIVMASIAAVFSGLTIWAIVAWAALAVSVSAGLLPRRNKLLGVVATGMAIQALLRLPALYFFGFSSLVAALACGLVLIGGYRYATRRTRQVVRRSVGAISVLTSIIVLVGAVPLLNARADVDIGVAAARRGLAAARSGDTAGVAAELDRAEVAFSSANIKTSSSASRLLRLIPVAAQHQRTIEAATTVGAEVAREAAATVLEADIDAISLRAGSVDLAALQAMAPQLRQTANSLEAVTVTLAATDSPWILPPLRNRIVALSREIDELGPEIALAADAAETVPSMLGLGAPDTYFVIFGTPAESRELGGFVGSWALISFDDGRLVLGESGRINELNRIAAASSVAPGTVSDWFMEMARPTQFPQNLTSSPDFAQVADISRQVIGAVSDEPLSGFIYVDATALVDMLKITGPLEVPFQEAPLTPDNASKFFFEDQYRVDASDRTEVFDGLATVAGTVVDRMTQQTLPGPEELGRILGPAARAGHLQVVTFDDDQNDFLRSVKLLRDFGRDETQDFVGVVQANGRSNKMDLYLHRTLDYVGAVDADGAFQGTATVTLRSVVPDDAPDFALGGGVDRGDNTVLVSLYSRHGVTDVTVNGAPVEFNSSFEFGLGRYLLAVTVPPNADAYEVEYSLAGFLSPREKYSLEVWHQPLVNTDDVTVSVTAPDGLIEWSGPLVENEILQIGQRGGS